MKKQLYAVFWGNKWGTTANRKTAIRIAKANRGEVRAMPWPDCNCWDAPTFRVCSEQIATFA